MDIREFFQILNDPHYFDYEKMAHKYGKKFEDFLEDIKAVYAHTLPLKDFEGKNIVYTDRFGAISADGEKEYLMPQNEKYGLRSAEEEIIATAAIEQIDLSRDSVRRILKGYAPKDREEDRIFGLKSGLDFISDPDHAINEENLLRLYQSAVGNDLDEDDRLKPGHLYRHAPVYIVSDRVEHTDMPAEQLPEAMAAFIGFINRKDGMNDLVKAAVIHFYFSYAHPYFDGNGRMARLLHLWFLIRRGYRSALFLPFSYQIEKNRKKYYQAFTQIEKNRRISGHIDVTPFIRFCIEQIYNRIDPPTAGIDHEAYSQMLKKGLFTPKENELWQFVVMNYGAALFSTKQLEKDFGNAAYATIRAFVLKFTELGLLTRQPFGSRIKYCVKN